MLAQRHGLHSVASVAHPIGLAAAAGGQRAMVSERLGVLGKAVGSERGDRLAEHAHAGVCPVWLAG